jgi:hypothetical protein
VDIITHIMRQHHRMQRLHRALLDGGDPGGATADLAEAMLIHTGSTEALLGCVDDGDVVRDLRAHRAHHERMKVALFQIAMGPVASLASELEVLERALLQHARHEIELLQSVIRAFDRGWLEASPARARPRAQLLADIA